MNNAPTEWIKEYERLVDVIVKDAVWYEAASEIPVNVVEALREAADRLERGEV